MTARRRYRSPLGPDARSDVDDELAFHLAMRERELLEQGETPERARELALRRFGDYDGSRNRCVEISERRGRTMARVEYLSELRADVGYALRTLARAPAFAAAALITLALGIGANSAIFSVVNGVLLSPLPYQDADRLYSIGMLYPDGTLYGSLSAPDFASVRDGVRSFDRVESYSAGVFTLLGSGDPKEVRGASVSDGLFDMLGVRPELGRGFVADEFVPGQGMVAVLDHGFWQSEFGGDRTILGRTVTVGGDPYVVVGVLAAGAGLPYPVDMYAPLEYTERFSATAAEGRRSEYLSVLARARAGADAAQLEADVRRIGSALQSAFPESNEGLTFRATPLREIVIGDVRAPLLVLMGAVGFVLLVACANTANLLLARASGRQSELAVRAALGAGRGRLLRQLLTESVVLGLVGGVLGLVIAYWGTQLLVGAQPADIPRIEEVRVNGPVVLFTLGLALLTGLVFGALPALQSTGDRLSRSLREGGRGSGGARAGHRVRGALVVAEMALAVVLLMGAGLLIRSFVELTRVDPGFQPEQAMAFRLTFQGDEYADGAQIRARVGEIVNRLDALPGVSTAAAGTVLPLSGLGSLVNFSRVGQEPLPNVNMEIGLAGATPDYFKAIGAPLVRGRAFSDADRADSPPVSIINEAAARFWFPGEDPIGRRVIAGGDIEREIVGIVGDVLQRSPGESAVPQLFRPYEQFTTRSLRIVVRTATDPIALAPAIRAEIGALDPNLPIGEFTRLTDLVDRAVAQPRFYTSLLALFAAVALALAATGIFGVLSYAVAQRSREISIRMALGARSADVLTMIISRALALAVGGVVLGVAGALALGRVLQSQLYGVTIFDPVTLATVVTVLVASAAAASYLPARRAAALQPGNALRDG